MAHEPPKYMAQLGGDPEDLRETWLVPARNQRELEMLDSLYEGRGYGIEVLMIYVYNPRDGVYEPTEDRAFPLG